MAPSWRGVVPIKPNGFHVKGIAHGYVHGGLKIEVDEGLGVEGSNGQSDQRQDKKLSFHWVLSNGDQVEICVSQTNLFEVLTGDTCFFGRSVLYLGEMEAEGSGFDWFF